MMQEATEQAEAGPDEKGLLSVLPASPANRSDDPHCLRQIERIEGEIFRQVEGGTLVKREMPVRHTFQPGVYIREIFMPAATYVIGQQHNTQHTNFVTKGKALVSIDGTVYNVEAGDHFLSSPGVRKVLFIIEDMNWITVHENPDNCHDIPTLEARLIVESPTFEDHQKNLNDLNFLKTSLESE